SGHPRQRPRPLAAAHPRGRGSSLRLSRRPRAGKPRRNDRSAVDLGVYSQIVGHTSIDSEIDRLYGLALEEFRKERDALARRLRADGNRDDAASVAELRKPVLAAWVVNRLAPRARRGDTGAR